MVRHGHGGRNNVVVVNTRRGPGIGAAVVDGLVVGAVAGSVARSMQPRQPPPQQQPQVIYVQSGAPPPPGYAPIPAGGGAPAHQPAPDMYPPVQSEECHSASAPPEPQLVARAPPPPGYVYADQQPQLVPVQQQKGQPACVICAIM